MDLVKTIREKHVDQYGLVLPQGGPSGNGSLFSGIWMMLRSQEEEQTKENRTKRREEFYKLIGQITIVPGLYKRAPGWDTQDSIDNYIGIAAGGYFSWTEHAEDILNFGKAHWYVFNNEQLGKFRWKAYFGRFVGVWAHIQLCAGIKPNLFRRIAQAVGLYITTFKKPEETSDRLLGDVMVNCLDNHWVSEIIRWFWKRHLHKKYGERGINRAVQIYYGIEHPFSHYWY